MAPTEPAALTLTEAGVHIGVSPQRVGQLLDDGDLEGPDVPLGAGGRAPKNAPRVWWQSAERERQRRQGGSKGRTSEASAADDPNSKRSTTRGIRTADRTAALELKVGLDAAREALRSERERSERLAKLLRDTAAALQAQTIATAEADSITDSYARALGSFLTPDDASDL